MSTFNALKLHSINEKVVFNFFIYYLDSRSYHMKLPFFNRHITRMIFQYSADLQQKWKGLKNDLERTSQDSANVIQVHTVTSQFPDKITQKESLRSIHIV